MNIHTFHFIKSKSHKKKEMSLMMRKGGLSAILKIYLVFMRSDQENREMHELKKMDCCSY